MNTEIEAARALGETIGCWLAGVPAAAATRRKQAAQELDARKNPEARVFEHAVIKLAADLMAEAGRMRYLAWHVADSISKSATQTWPPEFSEFSDMVLGAIGREVIREKRAAAADTDLDDGSMKVAAAKWLLSLVGRGASLTPDMMKALLGVSALGGGALGGVAWKLNRDTTQDEADLEAMRAKIDAYDRIAGDIEGQLKERMAQ